jgi:hypothetical protein
MLPKLHVNCTVLYEFIVHKQYTGETILTDQCSLRPTQQRRTLYSKIILHKTVNRSVFGMLSTGAA